MENLDQAWDDRVEAIVAKMPERAQAVLRWLREPSRRVVRGGAALLLIGGGLLSFLPILGIWMLPLGLALLAEDVPSMKPRLERWARWLERRWRAWFGAGAQPDRSGTRARAAVRPPSGA